MGISGKETGKGEGSGALKRREEELLHLVSKYARALLCFLQREGCVCESLLRAGGGGVIFNQGQ